MVGVDFWYLLMAFLTLAFTLLGYDCRFLDEWLVPVVRGGFGGRLVCWVAWGFWLLALGFSFSGWFWGMHLLGVWRSRQLRLLRLLEG